MVRAIIIDPALRDEAGHHLRLSIELSKAAKSLGHDPVWLGHRELDRELVPDFVRFSPVFSSSIYERQIGVAGRLLRPALGERRIFRSLLAEREWEIRLRRQIPHKMLSGDRALELIAALDHEMPNANDHLIIHSADPQTVDMLIGWAAGRAKNNLPSFHIRTCWAGNDMPFADYGGGFVDGLRRLSSLSRVLTVSAETPAGARRLAHESNFRVDVCRYLLDDEALQMPAHQVRSDPLIVGWLGGPRPERGANIIPDIIRVVLAARPRRQVKFVLQCAGRTSRNSREFANQLAKFGDAIEQLPVSISRASYLKALDRCDVLLLPYEPSAYPPERGSGAAIEALLTGKPMVTTSGTFAAELIDGGNGLAGLSAASLGQCILNIEADFERFRMNALLVRDRVCAQYDRVQNYLSLLGRSSS